MKYIPYARQDIDKDDIKAVIDVLRSDWITQGPGIAEFEKKLAAYCGARYAVAVSSGTAALHIACLAAGLGTGDEAITTPITFLATPNSIVYTGAKPVFADIDYETVNIDPCQIERRMTRKTKAILPVHFAGLPCDMPRIAAIARKNKLKVIEDACHALGAEYKHRGEWIRVGSCRHSDMTVFSFHPVKHITTGEGGVVTTNSARLYKRLKMLSNHGIVRNSSLRKRRGRWYYEMRELGFNYRITDFQCALGISQLRKVDGFVKKRREIARIYDKEFRGIDGVEIPCKGRKKKHSYHLYILKIKFKDFGVNRQKFFVKLRKKGILCQVHYIPVYNQPYYRNNRVKGGEMEFRNSRNYYRKAISIPLYPAMRDSDVKKVIVEIKNLLDVR